MYTSRVDCISEAACQHNDCAYCCSNENMHCCSNENMNSAHADTNIMTVHIAANLVLYKRMLWVIITAPLLKKMLHICCRVQFLLETCNLAR